MRRDSRIPCGSHGAQDRSACIDHDVGDMCARLGGETAVSQARDIHLHREQYTLVGLERRDCCNARLKGARIEDSLHNRNRKTIKPDPDPPRPFHKP